MKRACLRRWPGQLLAARPSPHPPASTRAMATASLPRTRTHTPTTIAAASIRQPWQQQLRRQQHSAAEATAYEDLHGDDAVQEGLWPSPLPERALHSAKLAALHARLSLPDKLPLQTLARALVDPSADADSRFNNANLAYVGHALVNYLANEWLVCTYPRLPFSVAAAATRGYAGPEALAKVARSWGVEAAAEPGDEVDPGLLQFSTARPRGVATRWGYVRPYAERIETLGWRHSLHSRVVMDDEFGDALPAGPPSPPRRRRGGEGEESARGQEEGENGGPLPEIKIDKRLQAQDAHADLVRAVVGALYAHCGREAAVGFVKAHVLSRRLDLASLFGFRNPIRELATLCKREEFEQPVARMLSETGRSSRTPVFVVGIFSGGDKLGEGAAATLPHARHVAAMNALKAWYLYSPGPHARLPGEMLVEGARPWEPVHVDPGEVI
ncbi:hypothetical protein RB594_000396 [Gaeumannomyces avenae]